jgi:phosphoglycerate dehydrogenase-like enzyme
LKPRAIYYSILRYDPRNRARLDELFDVTELADPSALTEPLLAETEVLFAPLGYEVTREILDRGAKLRVVVSNTTGIPHIDAAHASTRGIAVAALHDEQKFLDTITPTAEHTLGLLLACWRKIPAAHDFVKEGKWDRRPWAAPRMFSRMGLGIVGLGRLGKKVARMAEAMGMTVRFYDPGKTGSEASLADLAAVSDVLSLHAPALESTRGMISREILQRLPAGAVVINTARGELLDLDALLDLLESGHLYAAALDTLEGEYAPGFAATFSSSRVVAYARTHDNLILTPHIGGSTRDAWFETERFVIEKAARILAEGAAPRP